MAYDSESDRTVVFGDGSRVLGDTWAYDLNTDTWTNLTNPGLGPSPRQGHAMAYDSQSDRVILFGGIYSTELADTWAYDLNRNTWTNMTNPGSGPSGRYQGGSVYDSESDRVILFGGNAAGALYGTSDTWAYDFNTNTWTNMTNAGSGPSGRREQAMTYDPRSDRVILFGGDDGSTLADTWAYDFNTNSWTNRTNLASVPPARSDGALAYDSESNRVLLFGGYGSGLRLGDTWTYDFSANAWTNLSPANHPLARYGHGMAYDSQSDRVLLFGGGVAVSPYSSNEIWAYDFNTNAWANPVILPAGRSGHSVAYAARPNRFVIFGGTLSSGASGSDTWVYDPVTNLWTNMSPVSHPSARYGHALSYDSVADRVVLFGGFAEQPTGGPTWSAETWAYDLRNNTWSDRSTLTHPEAREGHAMVYDARANRIIMFGGEAASDCLAFFGTWAYDFANNTWTDMGASTLPRARCDFVMAYDSRSDRAVLFGGRAFAGAPILGETWAYNLAGNVWTNETPAIPASPSPRLRAAAAYASESNRTLLFGGVDAIGRLFDDTWAYDFLARRWSNLSSSPHPSGREMHAMAYGSYPDRAFLFGGITALANADDETWTFDLNGNAWTKKAPRSAPSGRNYHAMAGDTESGRVILFGGVNASGRFADTWAYDVGGNTWTDMSPPTRPPARLGSAMAYDSGIDRVILFGGTGIGGVYLSDTWAYDFNTNTWTNMSPPVHPAPRVGSAIAYDSESHRIILFGGGHFASVFADTWAYDFNTNTWTNSTNPASTPPARGAHVMAYDSESDRVILFSGVASGGVYLRDTWTYDFNTNTWTNMTTPSAKPSGRYSSAMAYDSESDRVVLFGGKTSAAPYYNDETWAYDLNTNTWTNMSPTTKPPARSLHAMAYDVRFDRVVLFAGENATGILGDAWAYDDPPNHPSPPRSLQAFAGNGQVTLSWQPPSADGGSPVTSYVVYRGTIAGGESLLASLGTGTAYTDLGVSNGVTYYYEVSAVNAIGESSRSGEVSATPVAGPSVPAAPSNLAAAAGNAQVTLRWQAPPSDGGSAITNYRVYRGTASGSLSAIQTIGNLLTYSDTTLTNGQTYFYELSAINSVGEGPPSIEVSATPSLAADTTDPTITISFPANGSTVAPGTLSVSGTSSDDVGVAKVEISADGGTTWIQATGTASWSAELTLAQGSSTIRARATDTSGNTATASVVVTVALVGMPGLPAGVIVGSVVAAVAAVVVVAFLMIRRRRRPPRGPQVETKMQ